MSEQSPGQSPNEAGRDQDPYSNASGQPPSVPPGQPIGGPPAHPPRRHRLRNVLLAASAVVIVIIAVAVGVALGKHSSGNSSGGSADSSAPATNVSSAAPSSAAALPSGGQQYASDMQSTFNFNSSVAVSDIASFGQQVCQDRQSGTSVAGEVPTAQQHWSDTSPGDAIQMITLAEKDMCPSELAAQTVTYVVTGNPTALKFSGLWGLMSDFLGLVTVWLHVGRGGVTGCGGP